MLSVWLLENTVSCALWSCRKSRRRFLRLYWLLLICALLYGMSALTLAAAETAQIGIVLPTAGDGVKQADVGYARSTSKRLTRMLAGIGLAADTIEEAALIKESARGPVPRVRGQKRLLILPMNAEVSPQTADYLKEFVAGGGKLLVTYMLAEEVAQLLHLQRTDWLREEQPGKFASVHLNAPGGAGDARICPASIVGTSRWRSRQHRKRKSSATGIMRKVKTPNLPRALFGRIGGHSSATSFCQTTFSRRNCCSPRC